MNIPMTIPNAAKDRILAAAGYGSGTDAERVIQFMKTVTREKVLAVEAIKRNEQAKMNTVKLTL